jgi:hypothetical protein
MPYKMYCDRCEKQTDTNFVSQRAIIDFEGWKAEVMLCNPKHVWNDGILCGQCLQLMLQLGCKRPKNETDVQEQR